MQASNFSYRVTLGGVVLAMSLLLLKISPLVALGFLGMGVLLFTGGVARKGQFRSVSGMDSGKKPVVPSQPRRALVVGSGAVAEALASNLEASKRYSVVGFVDDRPLELHHEWRVLGTPADLSRLVERHSVVDVFVALPPTEEERRITQFLGAHPEVKLAVVPTAYHSLMRLPAVDSFGDLAVVPVGPRGQNWQGIKRVLEMGAAALMMVILSPVMALAALGIRLTSPGAVLFRQERVGQFGRRFTLYKFRTMVMNAESMSGPVLSSGQKDPRLTRFGSFLRRSRVDELPQLWNVLIGDMSLVGPRPERPCFVEQFSRMEPLYEERHVVRPGITGLAQVRAGYHTDARDKLRYDLLYVSHPSPLLDLEILLRTVGVVGRLCG